MAKSTRGGKRTAASGGSSILTGSTPVVTPTPVTPPTPQQVSQGNVLPNGGIAFDKFQQMTDDEKADVVTAALGVGVPLFLDDSDIQKFAYYTGMSDKPTKVSDAQLDNIKGQNLYRTVNDVYNRQLDIGYTANDIAKQVTDGDFTMYSDSGGSAHGKAIYFAGDFGDSASYGNSKSNAMIRAKITSGKTIRESQLDSDYMSAYRKGDKLAVACSKADSRSARNLYALAKGYSVITPSHGSTGYYMVLNRGALTVSDKVKKNVSWGGSW